MIRADYHLQESSNPILKTVSLCLYSLLLLGLFSCTPKQEIDTHSKQDPSLKIAAAANLSHVLPNIIETYYEQQGVTASRDIEVAYASSGKLYAQIVAGAPYDIFLSADEVYPRQLAKTLNERFSKVATLNTDAPHQLQPFTYTRGQLAIYSTTQTMIQPLENTVLSEVLTNSPRTKVTIANPELAPYGTPAKAYLQRLGLYKLLKQQDRLIQSENVAQAFQYTHMGNVDYGFVALSQLLALDIAPNQYQLLPIADYPAILQGGLVVNETPQALQFSTYLQSDIAQQQFIKAGYLPSSTHP